MIGVAQDDLHARVFELLRCQSLDGGLRPDGHEGRCVKITMRGMESAHPRRAVGVQKFERQGHAGSLPDVDQRGDWRAGGFLASRGRQPPELISGDHCTQTSAAYAAGSPWIRMMLVLFGVPFCCRQPTAESSAAIIQRQHFPPDSIPF
jgi:hypothetical protein